MSPKMAKIKWPLLSCKQINVILNNNVSTSDIHIYISTYNGFSLNIEYTRQTVALFEFTFQFQNTVDSYKLKIFVRKVLNLQYSFR